jgi:hypothetical protein
MNLRSPPSRRWFRARGPSHRGVRSSQYRRAHRRNGWGVARKLTGDSHRRQFKGCGASEMTIIERIELRCGGVATSVGWISCERETDCRDGSNEKLDPIRCWSGHHFSGSAVQTFGTNWLGQACPYPGPCFHAEWLVIGVVLSAAAYFAWKNVNNSRH